MKMTARSLLLLACFLLAGVSPVAARLRVGDSYPARVESPHPLGDTQWQREIVLPDATFLAFHLQELRLGPDDLFLVLDGSGREVFAHVGPLEEPRWLPAVMGGRVVFEIWPARGSRPWGAYLDEMGVGDALRYGVGATPESICGINDMKDPACYGASKRVAGDAVGRMLFRGDDGFWYLCTGSLISSYEHFLTNNHCVSTQSEADTLDVLWRYQAAGCGTGNPDYETRSTGAALLDTDHKLDYSLLVFTGDTPASRYGHLTLNPAKAVKGETIWIPEHPGGNPKQFAVTSDLEGGNAVIQKVGIRGNGAHTDVGYFADTQGGSSGSPVLDENNTVVALHHFGVGDASCSKRDMNQGVRMDKIAPKIEGYLGPPVVTSMVKKGNPFRIVVFGSRLSPGLTVTIDGVTWTNLSWKNDGKVVLKKGSTLKAAVPRNTPTEFTFQNPYVAPPAAVTWQWP